MAPGLHAQNKASQKTTAESVASQLKSRPFASGSDREDYTTQANSASSLSHNLNNISVLPPGSASTQPIQLMPFVKGKPDILRPQSPTSIGDHRKPIPPAALSANKNDVSPALSVNNDDAVIEERMDGQLPPTTPDVASAPKKTQKQNIKQALKNTFVPPMKQPPVGLGNVENLKAPANEWSHKPDVAESRAKMSLPKIALQGVGRSVGFAAQGAYGTTKLMGADALAHGVDFTKKHLNIDLNPNEKGIIGSRSHAHKVSANLRKANKDIDKQLANNVLSPAEIAAAKDSKEMNKEAIKNRQVRTYLKIGADPRKREFFGNSGS